MNLGVHIGAAAHPTEAQIEAGNYKKAHIRVQGLDISIENPKGSTRSGTDPNGKKWSVTMRHHYGYIRGYKGADKEHIDVFVGPNPESERVFIVNQTKGNGQFDEHKVMLGFDSEQAAHEGYLANYAKGWDRIASIKAMSIDAFKTWLEHGDTEAIAKGIHLVIAPTIIKAIVSTPHMPGTKKVDWNAVPVGASIWITVTDESSPLRGRPILITKRPDGQAVIDPGEARRHGYKVGSWADTAFKESAGMAHATFQFGKLKESEKDVERLRQYHERLEERKPYEEKLRGFRREAAANSKELEEKFLESVGISKLGLTQLQRKEVNASATRQALDSGLDKETAESYGKVVARVRDQIERRFQRDAAVRRLSYYQRALEKILEQGEREREKAEESPPRGDEGPVAEGGRAATAEKLDEELPPLSAMQQQIVDHGYPENVVRDPEVVALLTEAAKDTEPLVVEAPDIPIHAITEPEIEEAVAEDMTKKLAEAIKRRDENKQLSDEAQKDAIIIQAIKEGEDPLDKILRTQDKEGAKRAIDAFQKLQQARAEQAEIKRIMPPKLQRPETSILAAAVEQLRLKAVEAVDEEKIKESEARYRARAKMNLEQGFYEVAKEHWSDEQGFLLDGGVEQGANDYLNGLLKRKKGIVSGAAAAALTGIIGKHTGTELDIGRLAHAVSPEVAATVVGYWLVGEARKKNLKGQTIGGIVEAIEADNAGLDEKGNPDAERGLLAMEQKALARDKRLKESYEKIRQQKSNGELAAEATIMRLEANNILQRRENMGRALGSLVASGTLLAAMKRAQKDIDERIGINVGSSKENAEYILETLGIKRGKQLPPEIKIRPMAMGGGDVQWQITSNAGYLANRWGKSQPIHNLETKELNKIKNNTNPVTGADNPPHFKKLWTNDLGQEELFTYRQSQRNDVNFLRKNGGGLITRSTGAGKTLTHYGFVSHLLKDHPNSKHLIIVPDGLTDQWENQGKRASDLNILRIPEKQTKEERGKFWSQVRNGHVVVVSHSDALKSQSDIDWIVKHGFNSCGIDEPQNLKSQQSERLGAQAKRLINLPFDHRAAYSATPARESLDEVYDWNNWASKQLKGFDKRGRAMWTPKIGSKAGFGRMYAGAGSGTNAQDEAISRLVYDKLAPFMSGDDFKTRSGYDVHVNGKPMKAGIRIADAHKVERSEAQIKKQKEIEKGFTELKTQIEKEEIEKGKRLKRHPLQTKQRIESRLSKEMDTRHWNNLHGGEDNGKTAGVLSNIQRHIREGRRQHIIYVDSDAQRVSIGAGLRKAGYKSGMYDLTELNKRAKFRGQADRIAGETGSEPEDAVAKVIEQRKADWAAHKEKGEPSFIFIDKTSQAGHNLQKGDVLSMAGRPQDAAAMFQIIGRGDRNPREGDFHVEMYRYGDSPYEDAHWENIEDQIKVVQSITPAITKAFAGVTIKSMSQRILGERILGFFGLAGEA